MRTRTNVPKSRRRLTRAVLVVGLAGATFGMAAPAQASTRATGQDCVYEYFYNGSGIEILGHRCAKANITYAASGSFRSITSYEIYYDVTAGLSYGPHHNEDPYTIASGFRSGTQTWLSPDSGTPNHWITRDVPNATTYPGQTRVAITAVPDIPNVSDPHLHISTDTW